MRIYARNTEISEIDYSVAQKFVAENHRQQESKYNGKILSIGMFHKKDLIGVAQFCSPRTSAKKREYSVELLRLCFKNDVQVIGGASKLIKYYIRENKPSDIFTYQDTTGKNSNVYEQCGFTLAKFDKVKQFLVKDGLTVQQDLPNTAQRQEYYTLSQVVNRGPDTLLGTNLGEQFHSNGKRKTNIELFQELGWHIEETSGDKIYEWFNPDLSFYTYKITATDSDKYYYGVRSVKLPFEEITKKDCLNDNYFGSGGKKFSNWKKQHKNFIIKEIKEIFPKIYLAYKHESYLIGDLYLNDELCLNSSEGGVYLGKRHEKDNVQLIDCAVHGKVKHISGTCATCVAMRTIEYRICEIHGETKFKGDYCSKCISQDNIKLDNCVVHGLTKHINKKCQKCSVDASYSLKECSIHGLSQHNGNSCVKCYKKNIYLKTCEMHGETKHIGNNCFKCSTMKSFTTQLCDIHGETIHRGNICEKCKNNSLINIQTCVIHGEVKHIGETCYQCRSKDHFVMKLCDIHGETKHQNNSCLKCVSENKISMKNCGIHGETKHFGNTCGRCNSLKMFYFDNCLIHGETKFKNKECVKCKSEKSFNVKICEIHGETKFKGKSCCKCVSEKTAHSRWHKDKPKENCFYCKI